MTFKELTEQAASNAVWWFVITVLGAMVWVLRRVFTNHTQIEMLEADLKSRDEIRKRDRSDLQELKQEVRDLTKLVQQMLRDK